MNIQEQDLEIKYLKLAFNRLKDKATNIYESSILKESDDAAFYLSSYSREEEERLLEEADKWEKSKEGLKYRELLDNFYLISVKIKELEELQIESILTKYNLSE